MATPVRSGQVTRPRGSVSRRGTVACRRPFPRRVGRVHLVHLDYQDSADSGPCRSVIPFHADHGFQSMPITDSRACRSPIPVHADHPGVSE